MAWVAKIMPYLVSTGVFRLTRIVPSGPFSPVTVKAVGTPFESRPGQVATPLFKLRPETMPDDFLAGVEIDGAGSAESAGAADSVGAVEFADSVGAAEFADSVDSDGAALEAATGASCPRRTSRATPSSSTSRSTADCAGNDSSTPSVNRQPPRGAAFRLPTRGAWTRRVATSAVPHPSDRRD